MGMRRPVERYRPGSTPDTPAGLIPFLTEELNRIAISFEALGAGAGVRESAAAVPIDAVGTPYPLFIGQAPAWDRPGGTWQPATGTWTCPVSGLYLVTLDCRVAGLDAPGNQDYETVIELLENGALRYSAANSGNDAFATSCTIATVAYIQREAEIQARVRLIHQSRTGTVPAEFTMSFTLQEAA
jgi:hypothetical protein